MTPRLASLLAPLALAAALAGGCGGGGASTSTVVCQPVCPAGTTCTATGCVPDEPFRFPDLSAATADGGGCGGGCSGATPICRDGQCVACVTDDHCPPGQVCRSLGASAACVQGCQDDARCGGGSMRCCDGGCADISKDPAHCGACGTACAAPHATATCNDGACASAGCAAGWGDCNHDAADGCEVNLRVDPANCAACGAVCSAAHATSACAGACYVTSCQFGWDDCNASPLDGCEQTTLSDPRNCGGCGNSCPAIPHARNVCQNGSCQLGACDVGFTDCDGLVPDGCEVSTGTDAKNCGACGRQCIPGIQVCIKGECTCPPCMFAHAKNGCVNNQCALTECDFGWGDCDHDTKTGCELAILTDAKNCGACGNACGQGLVCKDGGCTCPQCNLAHARTTCPNGVCLLDSCLPGWSNCDGDPQNGCESDTNSDGKNCGACGASCPMDRPFCTGGKCNNILASCFDYFQAGSDNDDYYIVDPDGGGPLPQTEVWCDMTGGGQTVYSVSHDWGEWGKGMTMVIRDGLKNSKGSLKEWTDNCALFNKKPYVGNWHNHGGTYSDKGTAAYADSKDWWNSLALQVLPDATYDKILILQDSNSPGCWAWYAEAGSLQSFGSPVGPGFAFCRNGDTASVRYHIYVCLP